VADLSGRQRRHLRALGHHLKSVVHIGHEGVTDALARQVDAQLEAHELIKVKISENAPMARYEAAQALGERCGAQVAQVLGRTALLYRRRKEKPEIELPSK
jgi:RNA-binding protein